MGPNNNTTSTFDATRPTITAFPQKNNKTWMIIAICAIITTLVAVGLLIFFNLNSNNEIQNLHQNLETKQSELVQCQGLKESICDSTNELINFTGIKDIILAHWAGYSIDSTGHSLLIQNNRPTPATLPTYQTASFDVCSSEGYGATARVYRALPDGNWKFSENLSGHAAPNCSRVSEEEKNAFAGILSCYIDGKLTEL